MWPDLPTAAAAKALPQNMRFFTLSATDSDVATAKIFLEEELLGDEDEATTSNKAAASLVGWLFQNPNLVIHGICQADDSSMIFAAMVMVKWPMVINGHSIDWFVPLVAVNSALRGKGYFEQLVMFVRETLGNQTTIVFPGHTMYAAPRVLPGSHQQRWLKYNSAYSAQLNNYVSNIACTNLKNLEDVGTFFRDHGARHGIDWATFLKDPIGLNTFLCHRDIQVVAFFRSAYQHMAIVQTNRSDCVRVLWYAGTGTHNSLKFLKAIAANFQTNVLLDASHPLLLADAIVEQTEETDKTQEYTFYHNGSGYLWPDSNGCVALPCFAAASC